ncbi:MAG: hypothetical protein ACHQ52_08665 [Candidatus Eisenbacteria bacterium]
MHSTTASSVAPVDGTIVPIDPGLVPCTEIATFSDVLGGDTPGTNYDGFVYSGGLQFAERFVGQTLGYAGDFDAVSGTPVDPLALQVGSPGQNLDVFAYTTNVLAGLGHLGYPDLDAIGEGSIAVYFPAPQSRVSFMLVGGNGGSATLSFYRGDGSLIDDVVVSGLADLEYGFATADATPSIAGILIQNTDPSGIGVVNICHDGGIVSSRSVTWGKIKTLYR